MVPQAIKRRRLGAIAAIAAGTILVLCGCSESASTAATTAAKSGEPASTAPVTLRLTWWGNPQRTAAVQAAVDQYEKLHPNVTVQTEPQANSGYFTKLNTEYAGGNAPDVFMEGGYIVQYSSAGDLVDLKKAGLDTSKFAPSLLAQDSYKGKLYEIPTGQTTFGVVSNASLYDKYNVAAPKNSSSWADYAKIAKQISKASDGTVFGAQDDSWNIQAFTPFVRQYGQHLFATNNKSLGFTKATLKKWIDYWQSMRDSGAVPPPSISQAAVSGDPTKSAVQQQLAASGVWGTSLTLPSTNSWLWSGYPGDTQTKTPGDFARVSVSWAANSKGKHVADSVKFMDYLVNNTSAGKTLGIQLGVQANSEVQKALIPTLSPAESAVVSYVNYVQSDKTYAKVPPEPVGPTQGQQVAGLFAQLAEKMWYKSEPVDSAVDEFFTKANDLAKNG
ncbi:ABC transporter substrate-binding protein [Rathayibacter sp. CAU 1779]